MKQTSAIITDQVWKSCYGMSSYMISNKINFNITRPDHAFMMMSAN